MASSLEIGTKVSFLFFTSFCFSVVATSSSKVLEYVSLMPCRSSLFFKFIFIFFLFEQPIYPSLYQWLHTCQDP